MKNKILLLFLLLMYQSFSQTNPLEADRPDQTETPAIVPKGMLQVETGLTLEKINSENTTLSLPSTLWKLGISKKIELRVITVYSIEKKETQKQKSLLPVAIGFKINLLQENGWLPKTSLISHVTIKNWGSSNVKHDYYVPDFRFTMQHTLGDKFSLGYNLGTEWDGYTRKPTLIYTLTSGYSVTKKTGAYIELFGFAPQNKITYHNFDGGFTYLINNNFMVDLSSGFGLTKEAPKWYFGLGISFRI